MTRTANATFNQYLANSGTLTPGPVNFSLVYTLGLPPVDLLEGGANLGVMLTGLFNGNTSPLIMIGLTLSDADSTVQIFKTINSGPGIVSVFFGFDEFAGVDADAVTGIGLETTIAGNEVLVLDSLVATNPVPKPMSLTLAGLLGIGMCGGAYRRKKRALAV